MNMATAFAFDCFANKAKKSLRINHPGILRKIGLICLVLPKKEILNLS